MEIAIFNDLTTESFIQELEADGKKYQGLYVDMNNKDERKYVKEQAVKINDLIKRIDRKRIDESKRYKAKVEKEASSIIGRLKVANEPYNLLIDLHKAERAKILADEKRVIELKALAAKMEDDHEMGLLMNKSFEFDREQELKAKAEHEKQLANEREEYAAQQVKLSEQRNEQEAKDKLERERSAESARLANIEHVRAVNSSILFKMMECGLSENESKEFIKRIARRQIAYLKINY